MPQRIPSRRHTTVFRTSCLVAAMAAVSACSTTPRGEEGFVDSLADAGSRTWDRTMYLLGFDEAAKEKTRQQELERAMATRSESHLLDEVDLALLKEDAPPPTDTSLAAADEMADSPSWSALAAADDATSGTRREDDRLRANDALLPNEPPAVDLSTAEANLGDEGQAVALDDSVLVEAADLTHVVADTDTLWDIAKATTGDATNWHVLADINDLGPDAAVYPGQELVIPGDMRRPELAAATPPADMSAEPAAEQAADATLSPAGDDAALATLDGELPAGDSSMIVETDATDASALLADSTVLEIDDGETLWDFSKRTTGDATNWQAIAAANAFTSEQATKVRPGQSIRVPDTLLRESLAAAKDEAEPLAGAATEAAADVTPLSTDEASATNPERVVIEDAAATAVDVEIAASDAGTDTAEGSRAEDTRRALELVPIANAVDSLVDDGDAVSTASTAESVAADSDPVDAAVAGDDQPIRIVEAAYQNEPKVDAAGASAASDVPSQIMVSGTYYPKAVYNDADFSSSLLMRVPPGTKLEVSRAFGPWFEVQTAEGTGYVHARDIR